MRHAVDVVRGLESHSLIESFDIEVAVFFDKPILGAFVFFAEYAPLILVRAYHANC